MCLSFYLKSRFHLLSREYSVTIGKSLLKLISPSHCDNWVDRLSHVYTVYLLTSVAAFVKTVQSASSPISCWIPAEFDANSEAYKNYVNAHCWIQNTYNVPFHEDISTDVSHRQVCLNYVLILVFSILYK
jgi:hypothetical protein